MRIKINSEYHAIEIIAEDVDDRDKLIKFTNEELLHSGIRYTTSHAHHNPFYIIIGVKPE
jgi:hypothetical protein